MILVEDAVDNRTPVEVRISENSYCGRGLGIGQSDRKEFVFVYFLTGRSSDSQNCGFVEKTDRWDTIRTAQVVRKKIPKKKRKLIIYNATGVKVGANGKRIAFATNGAQTDTLISLVKNPEAFAGVLRRWKPEPDKPNNTARISGMIVFDQDGEIPSGCLSIIKHDGGAPVRETIRTESRVNMSVAGSGSMITTYREDGNPLPPYEGPPFTIPLAGSARDIGNFFWRALPKKTRVALFVRTFDRKGNITSTFVKNGRGEPR